GLQWLLQAGSELSTGTVEGVDDSPTVGSAICDCKREASDEEWGSEARRSVSLCFVAPASRSDHRSQLRRVAGRTPFCLQGLPDEHSRECSTVPASYPETGSEKSNCA